MISSDEIARTVLALPPDPIGHGDAAHWSELMRRVARTDFEGVALNARKRVAAPAAGLPAVVAFRQTGLRAWSVPSRANSVAVAIELTTHHVLAGPAFPIPAGKIPWPRSDADRTPPPDDTSSAAVITLVEPLDFAAILDIPPGAGRFALAVLVHDWRSNIVEVERDGPSQPAPHPTATRPPCAAEHDAGVGSLPTYLATTPRLPEPKPPLDMIFTVEPVGTTGLVVRGSFAVRAEASHLSRAEPAHDETDGVARAVAAVVPVSFVVVLRDGPVPQVFDWALPVWGDTPARAGDILRGAFAIDVLAEGEALGPGDFVAWAVLGGGIFGPVLFRIEG